KRYVIPETVKKDPVALEIYINAFERMDEVHKKLKNAGMPEEELVYLRLSGSKLDIMVTMNARELLLFFRLRTCTRAQWEIRGHAIEMLRILREVSPGIFNRFGPSCFVSKCTEGTLTCGRMDDMKKIFDPMNKSLSEDVLKEQTA
ncbi:MAG TPA: FAD-dependent thymidylate synthase, partial [Clostridiales bacterium]|nr:FAD-dependent thymidylate synthase [Clostridiales bacterium]